MKIPIHLAIIMDGNSRWAKQNNINKAIAYNKGIDVAMTIIKTVKEIGVKYLTIYAFSFENWNRNQQDITILMDLFKSCLENNVEKLFNNDISISFIGDRSKIRNNLRYVMNKAELISKNNFFKLRIAMSYSGKNEIIRAVLNFKKYSQKETNDIVIIGNEFNKFINPNNIPDPDFLIRTSGEQRLSNFLLWQLSYTELYFSKELWPDFTALDLINAIKTFKQRKRRYGK